MVIKIVSAKEWKKMGLPLESYFITPLYKWDYKKKKIKKPIITITNNKKTK